MNSELLVAAAAVAVALLLSTAARAGDVFRGAQIYQAQCAACHGDGGRPVMPLAPDFTRPMALLKPDLQLLEIIRTGRGAMPAYQGVLRDREILDVVAHLRTLR